MIDLDTIVEALKESWSADTAYDANDWSADNPARGQCVVSSLVIQDYLGGELVRYAVSGDGINETHYFNQLGNGTLIDTTGLQYIQPVTLQQKPISLDGFNSIREKRLADKDTLRRYEILSKRVSAFLEGKS